jgi:hypothetical protein
MKLSYLFIVIAICGKFSDAFFNTISTRQSHHLARSNLMQPKMVLDDFFLKRLDGIKRTFEALTERLADPDVATDRKQMLTLSRERAAVEKTVNAYDEWKVYLSYFLSHSLSHSLSNSLSRSLTFAISLTHSRYLSHLFLSISLTHAYALFLSCFI